MKSCVWSHDPLYLMKNQNLSSISELMISIKAWKMRFDYAVNYIFFKPLTLFLEFLPMVDCWPGPDFCSARPGIWPELPPMVPDSGKSRPDNKSRPPTSSPNGERPDMSRPCSHILCFWNIKKNCYLLNQKWTYSWFGRKTSYFNNDYDR